MRKREHRYAKHVLAELSYSARYPQLRCMEEWTARTTLRKLKNYLQKPRELRVKALAKSTLRSLHTLITQHKHKTSLIHSRSRLRLASKALSGLKLSVTRSRRRVYADELYANHEHNLLKSALEYWKLRRHYGLVDMHISLAKFTRYRMRCMLFEWHKITLTEEIQNLELIANFHIRIKLIQSFSQLKTLLWKRKLIEAKRRRLREMLWKWLEVVREDSGNPFLVLAM
mmetsp:Transcript_552/g.783  ORF Transcript_552/g.783 Transcript_552/m.783 type:complete len:228 (-) Transcript_552:8959-9642(-)